jgi:diaminohydroxyphosphoribosylaminopyrimidine deaminase/5-amino-6-(5-phosphoribosylamino)uracil reductase
MGTDANGMFAIAELTEMQQATDLQILDVRQIGQDLRLRAKPVVKPIARLVPNI